MSTTSLRYVGMAALATVGLVACTADGPDDAGAAPSSDRPSATTSSSPPERDPADGPAGVDAQSPPAPIGNASGPTLPFPADTRPDVSSVQQGFPVLVEVARGTHPGYVRYVFEFVNNDPQGRQPLGSRPAWDVRYVPASEAVMDGSGEPVPFVGNANLKIRFDGAAMHWDDGSSSLQDSVSDEGPLGFGGDFEGSVTWFLGLDQEQPFRAFFTGSKVVVDVVGVA